MSFEREVMTIPCNFCLSVLSNEVLKFLTYASYDASYIFSVLSFHG